MKKLLFLTFISISYFMSAQDCEIDQTQTGFLEDPIGAYSMQLTDGVINSDESTFTGQDTLTALPHALTGEIYNTYFGIRIPADTSIVYDLGSGPQLFEGVQIGSISITEVEGMPMGFEYACDNAACSWAGGDYGCASIYSLSPVDAALSGSGVQAYPLNFILSVDATYEVFGLEVPLTDIEVNDLLNFYVLVVEETPTSSVPSQMIDARDFQFLGAYPNPASDYFTIQYGNNTSEEITVKVYDILGNVVFSSIHHSEVGHNEFKFDANNFNSGIYTMSVSGSNNSILKRMIIE